MPPRYRSYILERLENGDSLEYKEVYTRLDRGEYSIEHIMPQKLSPAWTADLGADQAAQIHGEWLHRIANLTISAAPYNSHYPIVFLSNVPLASLFSGTELTKAALQKYSLN